jgi:ABC-type transport system substrate-binding protein
VPSNFNLTSSRVSRRRLLGAAAGAGGASFALSLIGCGGDSSSPGGQKDGSGLLTKLEDTTGRAKSGGTWPAFVTSDVQSFDARTVISNNGGLVAAVYSRLFKAKPGVLEVPTGVMEGDIVERWELADDGTTLTMKLNPAAVWDERAPTNGRQVTSDDVKANWEIFSAAHVARGEMVNSVSPFAPILSLTAPDASTVVLKLAFPLGSLLQRLGDKDLMIYPREAGTGFEPRTTVRGSGPWKLTDWRPSSSLSFSRNEKWHGKKKPFVDGWELYVIEEYAQRVAQFRARRLYGEAVVQEDIVQTKLDLPEILMYSVPIARAGSRWMMLYGQEGVTAKYFADERVRQAFSLLFDRAAFLEAFTGAKRFEGAGLQLTKRVHSHLHAGEPEWVDPTSNEIGEGRRFYRFDLAEAKKLLSAAAFPQDLAIPVNKIVHAYPPEYFRMFDATMGMLADAGLKTAVKERDYTAGYLPNVYYKKAEFEGMGFQGASMYVDAAEFMFGVYHPEGGRSVSKRGADPRMEADIIAMRRETNLTKRASMLKDLQKYLAVKQWAMGLWGAGVTNTYELTWPEAGNASVYKGFYDPTGYSGTGWASEVLPYLWIDQSQKKA